MVKTLAEVEYLKQNWMSDPCWDIETTEGFEDYKQALKDFRIEKETEWKNQYNKKLWLRSCKLGIKGNLILTEYLIRLEDRIEWLVERLDKKETL